VLQIGYDGAMSMAKRLARSCSLPLLATLACGPAGIVGDAGTTTTGPDTLESSTSQPDSTSTSETGDMGSMTFFVPPPADVFPPICDVWGQDCPEGEKCVPYASSGGNWDELKCVAIMGDQASGEPCWSGGAAEGTDNCDATSFCWDVIDVEGEPVGTCTTFCAGNPGDPMCPPGSQCLIGSEGTISLCVPTCDPLAQDCGAGLACFWANNDFNCIFTTEDIPAGQPCGLINDCAAGLGCIDAQWFPDCAGSACCSAFCDITLGDGPCDALPGTSCVAFFEEGHAPPGYEVVGICILA
jgi:hypothetical protein